MMNLGGGESDAPVCWIHRRPEPDLPGDYNACGECWHVWRTEAEFRADLEEWAEQGIPVPDDLSTVYSCPLCTHDF